jgi:hypothetical protein
MMNSTEENAEEEIHVDENPEEEEEKEEQQVRLTTLFLRVLLDVFEAQFSYLLGPRELTSLLAIFPSLQDKLNKHNLQRVLGGACSGAKGLGFVFDEERDVELTASETARVAALYAHARQGRWDNLPQIDGRRFFCDDAYWRFPLDKQPAAAGSCKVSSFCFLKPSSPNPWQNSLVIATDDSTVTVYVLDRYWYKKAVSIRLQNSLTSLVSSPRGSCMLGQNSALKMVLLVVRENNISVIPTEVEIHHKKIRTDAFISETLILAAEPYTSQGTTLLGDLYTLTLDRERLTVEKKLFLPNSGVLGVIAIREAIPGGLRRGFEYLLARGECSIFDHHCCTLKLVQNPRDEFDQRGYYAFAFTEALVVDWIFTPDKLHAYVVILTSQDRETCMKQKVELVRESDLGRCLNQHSEPITKMVVYLLDFKYLDYILDCGVVPFRMTPVFYRVLPHLVALKAGISSVSRYNNKYAVMAAEECRLTGGDRFLAARFPYSTLQLFELLWRAGKLANIRWDSTLTDDEKTAAVAAAAATQVHMSYNGYASIKPKEPYLFDATNDFCFLSIFQPGQEVKNLKVGRLCDCVNLWTIEEASRPRLNPATALTGAVVSHVKPQVYRAIAQLFPITLQTSLLAGK